MYKNKIITIVIPCHNEENGLSALSKLIPEFTDHIIVIDNLSTDNTTNIAQEFGALVVKEERKGYGYAYQKGFENIPNDTDIVVTCDGDATYPLVDLPQILDLIIDQGYDFISGSRFPLKNKNSMGFLNQIGNRALTFLFVALTGKLIKDSQSGMWIFKKEILKIIKLNAGGMPLSEEIKMEVVLNKRLKFKEFHIDYNERTGKTKLKIFRDGLDNLHFLFKKRLEILLRK